MTDGLSRAGGRPSVRRWRPRGDRGSAELVVATPLLLVMILLVVQFALFEHASQVAQTAASTALATSRQLGGSVASGQAQGLQELSHLGTGVILGSRVSVAQGPTTVTVTVTGSAESIVPFVHLPVRASASGPVERFVAGP